ncbi:MAG: chorismate mutase [Gaiellaceae bacterium]
MCRRTRQATAASACRCGSRRCSTPRTTTARRCTSTDGAGTRDDDPLLRRLREQVSDNDRALIEAMNRRLELVTMMWDYKRSRGLEVLDPEREEWMLKYLSRANRGPLSQQGLEDLFGAVLALTKRELSRED